jgi:uncharacterized protein YoaH (UPF0181 family)
VSITADFDGLWAQQKQDQAVVQAKALMQNCMSVIGETVAQVSAILAAKADTGTKDLDAALQKAFLVIKGANDSLTDKDIQELLNWAGK